MIYIDTDLQERNKKRVLQKIEEMGKAYLCHPANRITKEKFRKELKRNKRLQNNV